MEHAETDNCKPLAEIDFNAALGRMDRRQCVADRSPETCPPGQLTSRSPISKVSKPPASNR